MPGEQDIKPKPVSFEYISPTNAEGHRVPLYQLLDSWVARAHPHLAELNIGLQWARNWKPDKDDRLTLGKAVKASEMDRQTLGIHCWVQLNFMFWNAPTTTDAQRDALIDHELYHFDVEKDKNGDPRKDERGMICIRMVKHDCEEFRDVVRQHGIWKTDLEEMARVMFAAQNRPPQIDQTPDEE